MRTAATLLAPVVCAVHMEEGNGVHIRPVIRVLRRTASVLLMVVALLVRLRIAKRRHSRVGCARLMAVELGVNTLIVLKAANRRVYAAVMVVVLSARPRAVKSGYKRTGIASSMDVSSRWFLERRRRKGDARRTEQPVVCADALMWMIYSVEGASVFSGSVVGRSRQRKE